MKISETPPTQQFLKRWHFENSGVCSEAKLNFMVKVGSKACSLKAAASSTSPAEQKRASESTRFHRPIGERQILIRLLLCHKWNSKTFWQASDTVKAQRQGNPCSTFQWHNLHLSCKTRLKRLHIFYKALPPQAWETFSVNKFDSGRDVSEAAYFIHSCNDRCTLFCWPASKIHSIIYPSSQHTLSALLLVEHPRLTIFSTQLLRNISIFGL